MVDSLAWAQDCLDRAAAGALWPLAAWILVSGLDDLFLAATFCYARLRGLLPTLPPAAETRRSGGRRIAIYVPLWHEEAVIRGMLEHNLAAIEYESYDFFVGAYPNDPGTIRAVRAVAARSPRVHLALCPHNGPTSKADCLNWIYQRMLLFERENGVQFDVVMTHDAEDLIHPAELGLIDYFSASYDMIQIPVLPLPTPVAKFTHGLYCDDFAEFHWKDMPARWFLGGFIPSSGVGTAFNRESLEALAASDSNLIFRPDCLTEDYENGYRLRRLAKRQLFLPIGTYDGQPVATREFFPQIFSAAKRQRSRWITGIALQGWARNGWGSTWGEAYWFWRDRKGLVGNPTSLLANVIFLYGTVTWAWARWAGEVWGLERYSPPGDVVRWLALATAIVGGLLCAARAACSARIYGWGFAAWSPLRTLLGNLLNTWATGAAVQRYMTAMWTGQPLVWLKTEHAYPNLAALEDYKQPLDAILVASGAVNAETMEEVKRSGALASLADRLLELELVSEQTLLDALMRRHSLPGGDPFSIKAINPSLRRLIPEALARQSSLIPMSLETGILKIACQDLPPEAVMNRLQMQIRLPLEFFLVTRTRYKEILELRNSTN